MLLIQEGEIRIVPQLQAVQQAQTIVRRFIPDGRSLADELKQDRLAEDQRERSITGCLGPVGPAQ